MTNDERVAMIRRVDELTKIDGPHAWIQWKGTDVCMDVYCACGAQAHIDAEFAYNFRCVECGALYAVGAYVKLVPLLPGEHDGADDERVTVSGERE